MKNKLVDALNRETSQINVPCFCREIWTVYDGTLFRPTAFATGNIDVLMCFVCNSSSCISCMFLISLFGESTKFTFKNKCCLNNKKKSDLQTCQVLCCLMGYINGYITAFYVIHNLQRRKSWQEYPVEILKVIGVAGINKSNYWKVVGRFGCVLWTCKMKMYTELCLKVDLPKEKVEKLWEPFVYS